MTIPTELRFDSENEIQVLGRARHRLEDDAAEGVEVFHLHAVRPGDWPDHRASWRPR
ncbi:MAG: hypothetical protein M3376_11525 [Actinomycetota bacterium]|nr:hypothetical protein [Actinomycetota bacterium]